MISKDDLKEILESVIDERVRQDKKWGEQLVRDSKMCEVLGEEVGEVAKAILEKDWDNLEEELVQVAAVCVKWLEIRRKFARMTPWQRFKFRFKEAVRHIKVDPFSEGPVFSLGKKPKKA